MSDNVSEPAESTRQVHPIAIGDASDMRRRVDESEGDYVERVQSYLQSLDSVDDRERVRRISIEAAHAFRTLASVGKAVSVFGSSRSESLSRWGEEVRAVTAGLAREGFCVITGGGPGIMAEANRGASEAGKGSVGLTIDVPQEDHPNDFVTLDVHFHYFFLRKFAFVKYASAFVCFPGGFGTLDELFEALNLVKTMRLTPFPIVLFGSDYWSGLLDWMGERVVPFGCLSAEDLSLVTLTDDPEAVVRTVVEGYERINGSRPSSA